MLRIPIAYNIRNLRVRWVSTLVALTGIAGVVTVFVAMLSMAKGFQETLKATGSETNIMVRRGGSTSEMESVISLEQVKIISNAASVSRDDHENPIFTSEVVTIAALPMISTCTEANVSVRGVSQDVLRVRDKVKIVRGRFFKAGFPELVVGKNATELYQNLHLHNSIQFGGQVWKVVGILDAGGNAFDSELWCDAYVLNQVYKRPTNIFQSVTVKVKSFDSFLEFKDTISTDPRLNVTVEREVDYYKRQARMIVTIIQVLGFLIAAVMGIGAIFGALNTMYAAVSSRTVEIATLGALGFTRGDVVLSFILESLLIALLGGIIGSIIILPLNGFTASTINWATFSHLAFAFQITPDLMLGGILFSLIMGFLGGLFPALHASKQSLVNTLRGM
ncbi:MAG: ABC transporter permease [bacterium]